ncbi:MAG: tetratricopeptide repeat protein [Thermodesulfovibrionales bacterium]
MDEGVMGKGFCNDKLKVVVGLWLSFMLAVALAAYASDSELELFEKGYDQYLSYQPEKAVATFNTFLKEYPESSAKDAALFWLGKALTSLASFEEADKTFSELRRQFPDSPFVRMSEKEVGKKPERTEAIGKNAASPKEQITDAEKKAQAKDEALARAVEERDTLKAQLQEEKKRAEGGKGKDTELKNLYDATTEEKARVAEAEKKVERAEKEKAGALDEVMKLKLALQDERKKTEELKVMVAKSEGNGVELNSRIATIQEQQKKQGELENNLKQAKGENQNLRAEKSQVEKEREELREKVKRYEGDSGEAVRIKSTLEARAADAEKKAQAKEKELARAVEERDTLKAQLQEEKKRAEETKAKIGKIESKDKETKDLLAKLEEQQKSAKETDKNLGQMKEERERLGSEIQRLRTALDEQAKVRNTLEAKLEQAEKKSPAKEKELAKAVEERDRLKTLLEDERKKSEQTKATIAHLEGNEGEAKGLLAKIEKQQRNLKESEKYGNQLRDEKSQLESQIQRLNREKTDVEKEREDLKHTIKKYEEVAINVRGKTFTAPQILEYMSHSSVVLDKLGISDLAWRSDNIYDDFVNEQILFDEAKREGVTSDFKKHRELTKKYTFSPEEEDYLFKYLMLNDLIGRRIKEMPGEKIVESLLVSSTEKDKLEKALFATELQRDAKSGRSFEEMFKLHPRGVIFQELEPQKLEGWIKDRLKGLKNGEVSDVLLTEGGYLILKPAVKKWTYGSWEDLTPEGKDKVKASVRAWIEGLKKATK